MTALVRSVFLLLCAMFLMSTKICRADTCPGPNKGTIQDAHFHFTYESWDLPPQDGDTMFLFGRCVQVKSNQSVNINWEKVQLKGWAAPDEPLFLSLRFPFDKTEIVQSELGWGIDAMPKYHQQVTFIANEQELHPSVMQSRVSAKVGEWQSDLRAGKAVPDDAKQLRTAVSLVLPNPDGVAANYIYVVFESDLNVDEKYTYKIYYYGANGAVFYRSGSLDVAFGSPFLSNAAGTVKVQLGGIVPTTTPGATSIIKRFFPEGKIEREPTTISFAATGSPIAIIESDIVQILYEGKTLATFPIVFYRPNGRLSAN